MSTRNISIADLDGLPAQLHFAEHCQPKALKGLVMQLANDWHPILMDKRFDGNADGVLMAADIENVEDDLVHSVFVFSPPGREKTKINRHIEDDDVVINVRGLLERQWSRKWYVVFLNAVFNNILARNNSGSDFVIGRQIFKLLDNEVCLFRQDAPKQAKQIETWALLGFLHGNIKPLEIRTELGMDYAHPSSIDDYKKELVPLTDRLSQRGMSYLEIVEQYCDWLEQEAESPRWAGWQGTFAIAYAAYELLRASNLRQTNAHRALKQRLKAVVQASLLRFWDNALKQKPIGEHDFLVFANFVRYLPDLDLLKVTGDDEDDTVKLFEQPILQLMLQGKYTLVDQLLWRYGKRWKLIDTFWNEERQATAKAVDAFKQTMARKAYAQAVGSAQFGVACSLANHFDLGLPDEEMQEVYGLATDMGLPMGSDHVTYLVANKQ